MLNESVVNFLPHQKIKEIFYANVSSTSTSYRYHANKRSWILSNRSTSMRTSVDGYLFPNFQFMILCISQLSLRFRESSSIETSFRSFSSWPKSYSSVNPSHISLDDGIFVGFGIMKGMNTEKESKL